MGDSQTIRTTVIDTALAGTSVDDADVLDALCDEHLRATASVCKRDGGPESVVGSDLMDFDAYAGVGRAL